MRTVSFSNVQCCSEYDRCESTDKQDFVDPAIQSSGLYFGGRICKPDGTAGARSHKRIKRRNRDVCCTAQVQQDEIFRTFQYPHVQFYGFCKG